MALLAEVDALFLDAEVGIRRPTSPKDREGCDIFIQGTRDALVTLRSAIDESLRTRKGGTQTGTADLADEDGFYRLVVVRRLGP